MRNALEMLVGTIPGLGLREINFRQEFGLLPVDGMKETGWLVFTGFYDFPSRLFCFGRMEDGQWIVFTSVRASSDVWLLRILNREVFFVSEKFDYTFVQENTPLHVVAHFLEMATVNYLDYYSAVTDSETTSHGYEVSNANLI